MSADVFIDSNILIYAHDRSAGERHAEASAFRIAKELMERMLLGDNDEK